MAAPPHELVIYGSFWCGYCARSRQLLDDKALAYTWIDVDQDPVRRLEMNERSGRRTVPQIFLGQRHLGGCEELMALEQSGELDRLLAARGD